MGKNHCFSDHAVPPGPQIAPRHGVCDFQFNLTHWLCSYFKSTKIFMLLCLHAFPLFSPPVYNKRLFSEKKLGAWSPWRQIFTVLKCGSPSTVSASYLWCLLLRDSSIKWECWYYLENIGASIFHLIWCPALGFCWCGFGVKVEKNVSRERAETSQLGTIFHYGCIQIGRVRCNEVVGVPPPLNACIFLMGPRESSLSQPGAKFCKVLCHHHGTLTE